MEGEIIPPAPSSPDASVSVAPTPRPSWRARANVGAIVAIVGAAVYFLGTVLKSGWIPANLVGMGSSLPSKIVVGNMISYWTAPVLFIAGGVLGFGPRSRLGFSAGICLATGLSALASGVALFLAISNWFPAKLILAGSAIAIAGGVFLAVAGVQARGESARG